MFAKTLGIALIIVAAVSGTATLAFAWGCVAVAQNGAYGYSYHFSSRSGAIQRALEECSARGRGCQIEDCDTEK
jgi:hypothetical protein